MCICGMPQLACFNTSAYFVIFKCDWWVPTQWTLSVRILLLPMGVSGWRFLLVPAHPGSPGQRAVKQLRARARVCVQCDWLHNKPPLWTPFGFFKTRPDASCCVLFYLHSFTPGSKAIFFINPSHRRLSSFLSTETTDSRQLLLTMSLLFLLSV